MELRLPLVLVCCLALAVAGCSSGDTTSGSPEAGADATSVAEGGGDVATPDGAREEGSVEAGGGTCPNVWDLGQPDAGGICCCRGDQGNIPICAADGGSPSCPAGWDLHHDQECDPATPNGPCTAAQVVDGGGDVATPDGAGEEGGAEAGGGTCPNVWDLGRPDAGGICCCHGDEGNIPICAADGSPSCPAGWDLHHDQECDPATPNGPCTLPSDAGHD
jgi:hypothetical protein